MSNKNKVSQEMTDSWFNLLSDEVEYIDINFIEPSPENDELYRPIDPSDPEVIELSNSIAKNGILEPLVITEDDFIVSGHRRFTAANLAGLKEVPFRRIAIYQSDCVDEFLPLLREFNRQREKNFAEKLREELLTVDTEVAYQSLIDHREKQSDDIPPAFAISGKMNRSKISAVKFDMLNAAIRVINERMVNGEISIRAIHYGLLNDPPLMNSRKPKSLYCNEARCYKDLCNLITRARLEEYIPFEMISDETRPVVQWDVTTDSRAFVKDQTNAYLNGYWRDPMQSQPHHIEIIGEKNTIAPILKRVARRYGIPMITGRGYCSLTPRYELAQRFLRSGKEKLILLIVSDFDPDGEEIAQSFARSMRDDFGIDNVHPIKVALTDDQVEQFDLHPNMSAKKSSSQYQKFVDQYGEDVFELEALHPDELEQVLVEAIDSVIDVDLFNAELDKEKEEAGQISVFKQNIMEIVSKTDCFGD